MEKEVTKFDEKGKVISIERAADEERSWDETEPQPDTPKHGISKLPILGLENFGQVFPLHDYILARPVKLAIRESSSGLILGEHNVMEVMAVGMEAQKMKIGELTLGELPLPFYALPCRAVLEQRREFDEAVTYVDGEQWGLLRASEIAAILDIEILKED